jgi:hypothetical protein
MLRKFLVVLSVLVIAFLAFPGRAAMPYDESTASNPGGWSSEWVAITPGSALTLTHNLGGDSSQYATQLWFQDYDEGRGINNYAYGGYSLGGTRRGAAWRKLTSTSVEVVRYGADTNADQVRMFIWIPAQPPDYCSAWTAVAAGGSQVFDHNLGGNPDDYVVGLWFQGQAEFGINQQFMGGMEEIGNYYGAWWHNLTGSTVTVSRGANDPVAEQVRVCITVADPADYDSTWTDIAAGNVVRLLHQLGKPVDRYVVRMEFKDADPSGLGIHLQNAGGNAIGGLRQGAAWQNLNFDSIDIYRLVHDENVDQVRIRIWQRPVIPCYLPLVVR